MSSIHVMDDHHCHYSLIIIMKIIHPTTRPLFCTIIIIQVFVVVTATCDTCCSLLLVGSWIWDCQEKIVPLKIFVRLTRPCLEFSMLLNVFPTACFMCFIISFIIATPGMISGSFLATRWVTPRAMRIQSVTVATEQPETIKHWQELTVVMFLYNWRMD